MEVRLWSERLLLVNLRVKRTMTEIGIPILTKDQEEEGILTPEIITETKGINSEGPTGGKNNKADCKIIERILFKMKKCNWYVYMVECKDGSIYTGITNNVSERLAK